MHAYKAAILSALSLRQIFAPAQLGTLYKLCIAVHRRRPPKPSPIHLGDIGLVLHAFSLAPFELLATVSLEAITFMTFVSIALALGMRRGELCALRRGQFVRPAVYWSFELLFSDPSCFPKTAKG